jgi:trehalose 6-phosphate phosphatase
VSPRDVALFLDVDGTLLELAATPDAVHVDHGLTKLLRRWASCDGALALISGRTVAALDELVHGLELPAAGLHGFERRNALGTHFRHELPSAAMLDRVRRLLSSVAARNPGLVLEDKEFGVALHYRLAPHLEREVVADVMSVARVANKYFDAQRGKMVIELRPKGTSKGLAVAEFMQEPPFHGRVPVYFGDDLTDESAFEWVNSHGGFSVAVDVARATAATHQANGVSEVRAWLESNVPAEQAAS